MIKQSLQIFKFKNKYNKMIKQTLMIKLKILLKIKFNHGLLINI